MAAPLIQVSEPELADLRSRVAAARWPVPWPVSGWDAGTAADELRRLVDHWLDGFDWRAQEAAINALPAHVEEVGGEPLCYLMFEGERANATPIVLTHGWPSTVLEEVDLARRLSRPSAYGLRGERAFTAIVPALPGFPFSPAARELPPRVPAEERWHALMQRLGLTPYLAHGGDLGAGVTTRLARAHPESVAGIHLLAVADPPGASGVTAEEQAYLEAAGRWYADDGGYEHLQRTRPLTASYALADSPLGLLAWMLEKYHGWTDPPGLADDLILTQVCLYWFTNSISTSFRPYYEFRRFPPTGGRVRVPTAVAVFPHDLVQPPRSWAERGYNVVRFTRMPRGGHFAALEVPDLLAADLRSFAADLG